MFRCDELDKKILEKNIPFSATFELTYKCNLKCGMCYQFRPGEGELNTSEIKDILGQLADAGCLYLSFTGGEPFLREDIWELISHARERTFALTLQTNGTLIGETEADLIRAADVMDVHLSVLGSSDAMHDGITGVPGSFKKTIRAAELLIARKIRVVFKTTLMRENYSQYKDIFKLAGSIGAVPYFSPVIFPRSDGGVSPLKSRLSDGQLKDLLSAVPDKDNAAFVPCGENELVAICRMGISECAVNPFGDVYPCVSAPMAVGNLRAEKFASIWHNSNALKKIREITVSDLKECSGCALASDCLRCPGLALLEENDILAAPAECCRVTRIIREVNNHE